MDIPSLGCSRRVYSRTLLVLLMLSRLLKWQIAGGTEDVLSDKGRRIATLREDNNPGGRILRHHEEVQQKLRDGTLQLGHVDLNVITYPCWDHADCHTERRGDGGEAGSFHRRSTRATGCDLSTPHDKRAYLRRRPGRRAIREFRESSENARGAITPTSVIVVHRRHVAAWIADKTQTGRRSGGALEDTTAVSKRANWSCHSPATTGCRPKACACRRQRTV